ncbi:Ras guanine nucleotide exchange factor [Pelomyxa schiedti]|nr:Ras guanine nucleotide exchange factor [Pelomyxa schiedti]
MRLQRLVGTLRSSSHTLLPPPRHILEEHEGLSSSLSSSSENGESSEPTSPHNFSPTATGPADDARRSPTPTPRQYPQAPEIDPEPPVQLTLPSPPSFPPPIPPPDLNDICAMCNFVNLDSSDASSSTGNSNIATSQNTNSNSTAVSSNISISNNNVSTNTMGTTPSWAASKHPTQQHRVSETTRLGAHYHSSPQTSTPLRLSSSCIECSHAEPSACNAEKCSIFGDSSVPVADNVQSIPAITITTSCINSGCMSPPALCSPRNQTPRHLYHTVVGCPPILCLPSPEGYESFPLEEAKYFEEFPLYHTAFEEPDSESNVQWMKTEFSQYIIRGGTVFKLVQFLTHPYESDLEFTQAFLTSYHAFVSGPELLDMLLARFFMRKPVLMEALAFDCIRSRIRLKVVSVLKHWVKLYFHGEWSQSEESDMVLKIVHLLDVFSSTCAAASSVLNSIELLQKERVTGYGAEEQQEISPPVISLCEAPHSVLDIHPEELARQIMLREWEMLARIHPKELVKQSWNKPTLKEKEAPNITRFIEETNKLTLWVINEILHFEQPPQRALAIHRFILTVDACLQMRSFNAAMGLTFALQDCAIHRLKHTWNLLPPSSLQMFQRNSLTLETTNNFQNYRDVLKISVPPCVPCLGVALKDIVFASDGNPAHIPGTSLINFAKYRSTSKITVTLGQFQRQKPFFEKLTACQELFGQVSPMTQDQAYDRSVILEVPRQNVDPGTIAGWERAAKDLLKRDQSLLNKAKKAALKASD